MGVNAGSGLGMMFLLVMYPTAATTLPWLLPVGAVVGAVAITALVFALAYRQGTVLPSRLLLVGIAMGFGAHAAMLLFSLRMSFVHVQLRRYVDVGHAVCRRLEIHSATSPVLPGADSGGLQSGRGYSTCFLSATAWQQALASPSSVNACCCSARPQCSPRVRGHWRSHWIPRSGFAASRPAFGRAEPQCRCSLQRHFAARSCCWRPTASAATFLPRCEIPAGVLVGILGGVYFLYLLATTRG